METQHVIGKVHAIVILSVMKCIGIVMGASHLSSDCRSPSTLEARRPPNRNTDNHGDIHFAVIGLTRFADAWPDAELSQVGCLSGISGLIFRNKPFGPNKKKPTIAIDGGLLLSSSRSDWTPAATFHRAVEDWGRDIKNLLLAA